MSETFPRILKAQAPLTLAGVPTGFLPWFAADLARAVHGTGKSGRAVIVAADEAAMRAIGAGLRAVDSVMDKTSGIRNAFCQVRPPGHHAEARRPMGFCLFNSIAIAAFYARKKHGAERVAVIDFDVHHGNGTQDIFWSDKDMFYASTHQMPLYPGTGRASETGAHGQVMNLPLPPGSGGAQARAAWRQVTDRLRAHAPQLVIVSAGFDAHAADPLASLEWDEDDFAAITAMIVDAAGAAPVVSVLEGGYDLAALGRSARAHVTALQGTAS